MDLLVIFVKKRKKERHMLTPHQTLSHFAKQSRLWSDTELPESGGVEFQFEILF